MSPAVVALGWTPIRGTRWLDADAFDLDGAGVPGDRLYSAVTPDLTCVKAMKHPELFAWVADRSLPADGGRPASVTYWGRSFAALVWEDKIAASLSEVLGERVLLARADERPGFIWDCPISLITTSELAGLSGPLGRYRANVVLDDTDAPVPLRAGERVALGEAVLELVRPIERCVLIDRNPFDGGPLPPMLPRLGPAVTLGWGCRVVRAGRVGVQS